MLRETGSNGRRGDISDYKYSMTQWFIAAWKGFLFTQEYWAGVHLLQNTCSLELEKQLLFHSFQESTASKRITWIICILILLWSCWICLHDIAMFRPKLRVSKTLKCFVILERTWLFENTQIITDKVWTSV